MKKTAILAFASLLPLLASCTGDDLSDKEKVKTLNAPMIGSAIGDIRVVPEEGENSVVNPFNTSISGSLYYYEGDYTEDELEAIEDDYSYYLCYFSALSDRHRYYTTADGDGIVNLRTINEMPRETPIEVDPFLYDLLKESYTFSLQTADSNGDLYFDIFTGALNEVYENKFERMNVTALDKAMTLANGDVQFAPDIDEGILEDALSKTPSTLEECDGLLSFDDEKKAVTFHELYRDGKPVEGIELSLSGVAKGFATEFLSDYFSEKYPNISLLINSGTSSIKAIGERPDKRSWNIRMTNPIYKEKTALSDLNASEVYFSKAGAFSLSTSGYYEHYFYVNDADSDTYPRRDHILFPATGKSRSFFDQVTILLSDAGLADMYTTTLMLATSVEDALSLKERLDEYYDVQSEAIFFFKSEVGDPMTHYSYSRSEMSPLSDKGLPIVEVKDGNDATKVVRYEGDYSDIQPDDIVSSVTTASRDFRETVLGTPGIFPSLAYIEGEDMKPVQSVLVGAK